MLPSCAPESRRFDDGLQSLPAWQCAADVDDSRAMPLSFFPHYFDVSLDDDDRWAPRF